MCKGYFGFTTVRFCKGDEQLGKQMFSIESSTQKPSRLSVLFCV